MKPFSFRRVKRHTLLALRNIWNEFSSVAKVTTSNFGSDLSSQDRHRVEKLVSHLMEDKNQGWYNLHDVILLANWYSHLEDSGRAKFLLTIASLYENKTEKLLCFFSCFMDIPEGIQLILHIYEDALTTLHDADEKHLITKTLDKILSLIFNLQSSNAEVIDFASPAMLLEKISSHQSLYLTNSWVDLKNRFNDHHVYFGIFFHALLEDPALVVRSKLTNNALIADDLGNNDDTQNIDLHKCHSILFYDVMLLEPSMNNNICVSHKSMRTIIEYIQNVYPHIKYYRAVTPLHGFMDWLTNIEPNVANAIINVGLRDELTKNITDIVESDFGQQIGLVPDLQNQDLVTIITTLLSIEQWYEYDILKDMLYTYLIRLASYYILRDYQNADTNDVIGNNRGFHLRNGAGIDEIQWLANLSSKNIQESAGMMVVYSYQIADMELNCKKYSQDNAIVASTGISKWLEI